MVETVKKATRFSFINNKDTTLTAPERVVAARSDSSDDEAAQGETHGKKQKFVAAKKLGVPVEETKGEPTTVLGKRKHKERGDSSDSADSSIKKKSKKHKSKKEKKEKKSSKLVRRDEDEDGEARPERWVCPERNPWTGRPFSDKFYDILQKRKELPAW